METKFIEIKVNIEVFDGMIEDLVTVPIDQIKSINTDLITMKDKEKFWLVNGEYDIILKKLDTSREHFLTPEEDAKLHSYLSEKIESITKL